MNVLLATNFSEFNNRLISRLPNLNYIGMPSDEDSLIAFLEGSHVDVIIYSILFHAKSIENLMLRVRKMVPDCKIIYLGSNMSREKKEFLYKIGFNDFVTGVLYLDLIEEKILDNKSN